MYKYMYVVCLLVYYIFTYMIFTIFENLAFSTFKDIKVFAHHLMFDPQISSN